LPLDSGRGETDLLGAPRRRAPVGY
jgi:hypothetical protein